MPLIDRVSVTLVAGATASFAHALGVVPDSVMPDRGTVLVVNSADASTINVTNPGILTETAIFTVAKMHSFVRAISSNWTQELWQGMGGQGSMSSSLDAFGRLRVSNPTTVFDSKQLYTNQPQFWDEAAISGSGTSSTFNTNRASTLLNVSADTAGTRVRQTLSWHNYQPGKSQLVTMTFVLGSPAQGITRRVGIFETKNGLFLEQTVAGLACVSRSFVTGAAVDTRVARSDWNIDKMDGLGVSGYTLDETKAQLLAIDFSWQGEGSVRFGFYIDGIIHYVHQINHSNNISSVYMSNPNLPLRYEISNDGSGAASNIECICVSIVSEGGRVLFGTDFTVDRADTPLVTLNNASIYPLIAMRLQSGRQGTKVIPTYLSLCCTSTAVFRWAVLLNPTVTGTAFSFSAVTNSNVEVDVARLNATTVSGGTQILSGYAQSPNNGVVDVISVPDIELGTKIDGTSSIIVLAVQRNTGAAETFYGSLGWHELQ